ncbi:MAG: hypothetical protein WB580_09180 [Candidatus Binataceae bacterium]
MNAMALYWLIGDTRASGTLYASPPMPDSRPTFRWQGLERGGDMLKCNACGAVSGDVHILEAEGGPMPDRGVIAVRIKICNSCYSRPERSQLLAQLCADILVPPSYWFGRNIAWSSAIRVVRSPRGQRAPRFWYEPEAHPLGYWSQSRPTLTNGGSYHAS